VLYYLEIFRYWLYYSFYCSLFMLFPVLSFLRFFIGNLSYLDDKESIAGMEEYFTVLLNDPEYYSPEFYDFFHQCSLLSVHHYNTLFYSFFRLFLRFLILSPCTGKDRAVFLFISIWVIRLVLSIIRSMGLNVIQKKESLLWVFGLSFFIFFRNLSLFWQWKSWVQ